MINPTGAAKAIRKELKALYPTIRIKVLTRRFSMGNAVDVYCPEALVTEIDTLIQKYCYGRFDGMQDLSYAEHDATLPQAKFVSANPWR